MGDTLGVKIGIEQAPATDILQEIPMTVGFQPQAMILASHGSSTLNSVVDNVRMSMGLIDKTSSMGIWHQDEHNQATSDTERHIDTVSALWFADDLQTLLGEASVTLGPSEANLN